MRMYAYLHIKGCKGCVVLYKIIQTYIRTQRISKLYYKKLQVINASLLPLSLHATPLCIHRANVSYPRLRRLFFKDPRNPALVGNTDRR